MNIISKILVGGTMAGTLLTGCNSKSEKFDEYMSNKPIAETMDINNKCRYVAYAVDKQRYLDSIAFKDVLKSTDAINNSAKVADFNKIASYTKADTYTYIYPLGKGLATTKRVSCRSLLDKLVDLNISKNEYARMKELNSQQLQYSVDSVAYRRFFEKHGLLNKSTLKKFTAVAKKIKP